MHRGDGVLQALRWGQCRETGSGDTAEASGAPPWGVGSQGRFQRPRPDQIASQRLSGATAWAQAPRPSRPHCGGSTHRDRVLGQRKRPLPSGPIGASISRGLTAPGFLAWVSEVDRGRAPPECQGHCFWCVHIPCPLGPQALVRNQTSRGCLDGRPQPSPGFWEAASHSEGAWGVTEDSKKPAPLPQSISLKRTPGPATSKRLTVSQSAR